MVDLFALKERSQSSLGKTHSIEDDLELVKLHVGLREEQGLEFARM